MDTELWSNVNYAVLWSDVWNEYRAIEKCVLCCALE